MPREEFSNQAVDRTCFIILFKEAELKEAWS